MTPTEALNFIKSAIVDTVKEAGDMGAPSGHIYAALMHIGISLEVYQAILAMLIKENKIRRTGQHLLFYVKEPV